MIIRFFLSCKSFSKKILLAVHFSFIIMYIRTYFNIYIIDIQRFNTNMLKNYFLFLVKIPDSLYILIHNFTFINL